MTNAKEKEGRIKTQHAFHAHSIFTNLIHANYAKKKKRKCINERPWIKERTMFGKQDKY